MYQRSRKGYVEQQIEQMAFFLAKILLGVEGGQFDTALAETADACKKLVGLNIATLPLLPDETLLSLMQRNGTLDAGKCVVAATLLDQQARIFERQTRTVAAQAALHKALVLLIEALRHEEILRTEKYREQIADILLRLHGYALPDSVQARLAAYRRLET